MTKQQKAAEQKAAEQKAAGKSDLSETLKSAEQKIADLTATSKRALADLANYKKRMEDERSAFAKFAGESLILEILPVLDNLQRALTHAPEDIKKNEWLKGLSQTEKQLLEILKKYGVKEIPPAKGNPFNPELHEAVMQGAGEKDIVLEELEKGYFLHDKVIRPTKVKVGDGSPQS